MNDINLLHKLVDAINNSANKTISIQKCMLFLLGEHLLELSESEFYKLYMGTVSLSNKNLCLLGEATDWRLDRFKYIDYTIRINSSKLYEEVHPLYKNLKCPNAEPEPSLESMFAALVHRCFFGLSNITGLFAPYEQKNCENFCCPNLALDIEDLFKDTKLVFITGAPGTGKTELAKYIITLSSYTNIGWLEPSCEFSDLDSSLQNLPFLFPLNKKTNENALNRLSEIPSETSILVIDLPAITPADFKFIEDRLSSHCPCPILITTRTTDIPSNYRNIHIESNLTDEYLNDIFRKNAKEEFFSDTELNTIFDIVKHNPFVVTLIAKTLNAPTYSLADDKEQWLNSDTWMYHSKNLPRIHTSYHTESKKNPTYSLISLMTKMLFPYPYAFLSKVAPRLAVWVCSEIEEHLLTQSGIFSIEELEESHYRGFLQYTNSEKTFVQMPALLADAVWLEYPIDYKDHKKTILSFLDRIQTGKQSLFSYSTLYAIIRNMIYRFHFQVTHMPSRPSFDDKELFNGWNDLLRYVIMRLIEFGNYTLAEELFLRLYIYDTNKQKGIPSKFSKLSSLSPLIGIPFADATDSCISVANITTSLKKFAEEPALKKSANDNSFSNTFYDNFCFMLSNIDAMIVQQEKLHTLQILTSTNSTEYDYFSYVSCFKSFALPQALKDYAHNTHALILGLHHERRYLSIANQEIASLHSKYTLQDELYFKLLLQQFYYNLLTEYMDARQSFLDYNYFYSQRLIWYTGCYNFLYNNYNNKIRAWDTSWLLFLCSLLLNYILRPDFEYGNTKNFLRNFFQTVPLKLFKEQLNLSDEWVELLMSYLKIPRTPE